jgi:DDE superfamily endonuclease
LSAVEELLSEVHLERGQHAQRLCQHALAQLVCLGSHTITGVLSVCGQQFEDWSADYRMYSCGRADPQRLFEVVRAKLCAMDAEDVVVALDDTRIRKTGKKVYGAKYTRDPLSPPFHNNLYRAQRFLQVSMALPGEQGAARMLPVDWVHAPTPHKPHKNADAQELERHKQQCKQAAIGAVGARRMAHLRQWMDENGAGAKRLWTVVDGSFTNGTVLKQLPPNTTLIGRIRSDAKLFHLPDAQPQKGRKRTYGDKAPTPEELRQDETHPWENVEVFFGGQRRQLRAKRIGPLRWRAAGGQHDLQMIVIAPTPYRLSQQTKWLYRQPAYLICTDPGARLEDIVQNYLWRWDIEVNFRDEKTILGVGQAQVRTPAAAQNATATAVAAYATLLLAAELCRKRGTPPLHLPAPKWQRKKSLHATTMSLIQNLRHDLWARSIHFSGFMKKHAPHAKPKKYRHPLDSAIFYASTHS